jgi:hypothetical protein
MVDPKWRVRQKSTRVRRPDLSIRYTILTTRYTILTVRFTLCLSFAGTGGEASANIPLPTIFPTMDAPADQVLSPER